MGDKRAVVAASADIAARQALSVVTQLADNLFVHSIQLNGLDELAYMLQYGAFGNFVMRLI